MLDSLCERRGRSKERVEWREVGEGVEEGEGKVMLFLAS